MLLLLFLPPRGAIGNFDGGTMAGFAPLDPPLIVPNKLSTDCQVVSLIKKTNASQSPTEYTVSRKL